MSMNSSNQENLHPRSGQRYTKEDLVRLADQGDAWALSRLDEWEQTFANVYSAVRTDTCTDRSCEAYGELVTFCYGEHGAVLDIDHGAWGHYLPEAHAKAS